jgi:hypothetical protein
MTATDMTATPITASYFRMVSKPEGPNALSVQAGQSHQGKMIACPKFDLGNASPV